MPIVDTTEFKENPDGSATVKFDFTPDEVASLFRQGVITALEEGIRRADPYDPDRTSKFNNKTIELDWQQLQGIVVGELQEAYRNNLNSEEFSGELARALKTVLEYYMIRSDFEEWTNDYD